MSPLAGRKFTAKVLTGSTSQMQVGDEQNQEKPKEPRPIVDYNTLMERSFGESMHLHEDKPPIPSDPSQYIVEGDSDKK